MAWRRTYNSQHLDFLLVLCMGALAGPGSKWFRLRWTASHWNILNTLIHPKAAPPQKTQMTVSPMTKFWQNASDMRPRTQQTDMAEVWPNNEHVLCIGAPIIFRFVHFPAQPTLCLCPETGWPSDCRAMKFWTKNRIFEASCGCNNKFPNPWFGKSYWLTPLQFKITQRKLVVHIYII